LCCAFYGGGGLSLPGATIKFEWLKSGGREDLNIMDSGQIREKIEVLLVEDNPGDIRLIVETLKEGRRPHNISIVKDGEEAISFLKKLGAYKNVPSPDFILLDLKLPRKDGIEVLKEVKGDEKLKLIPVIVLTSSSSENDIIEAYSNNANCYVTKPIDLDRFIVTIHSIEDFWFTIIKTAPQGNK
jgi:CheY-like chemotaxis protein